MRTLAAAILLAASACGPPAAAEPTPGPETGPITYTLCSPTGELPAPDVNAAAVRVVEARLAALGVAGADVSVGDCLDVTLPGADEDGALRSVLFASGFVEVLSVPADRTSELAAGGAPPDGLEIVLDSEAIAGATADAGAVDVRLTGTGAARLTTWTTTHAGETLTLVLDGRVMGSLPIERRDPSGAIRIPVPAEAGLAPTAVAALLAAGPLPGDWRQPDAPQG